MSNRKTQNHPSISREKLPDFLVKSQRSKHLSISRIFLTQIHFMKLKVITKEFSRFSRVIQQSVRIINITPYHMTKVAISVG